MQSDLHQRLSKLSRRSVLVALVFLFFHLSTPRSSTSALAATSNVTDLFALISFKSLISDGPSRALHSWGLNSSLPHCRWLGVTCGKRHRRLGRVARLDLSSLGLSGTISPSIGNLTFLTSIDLSLNSLTGHIPDSLTRCSHLKLLVLWGNQLGGQIPSHLSRCPNLTDVDLSVNQLVGSIPPELGSLSKLEKLILYSNNLQGGIPPSLSNLSATLFFLDLSENPLGGVVPPWLGELRALTTLHLTDNGLVGAIPPSLGALSSLSLLDLSENQLQGLLPPTIWNVSSLTILALSENKLHGTLPSSIGYTLPRLQFILLYDNQFSGPIPASLSNASSLNNIELNDNRFTGKIPASLGSLPNLAVLLLNHNRLVANGPVDWSFIDTLSNCSELQKLALDWNLLRGSLPKSTGNLSAGLNWVTMANNQISGIIPEEIGNLLNLSWLDISYNEFSGAIPPSIGRFQRLGSLGFTSNTLSGTIPSSLGNLTKLVTLSLGGNGFTGSIPSTIGECRLLNALEFSYNKLTGSVPVEVLGITTLSKYLSISHNSLTGPLPPQVGSLRNANLLDFSYNNFSGEIPSTIAECLTLESLYMQGNSFHGRIPSSMRELKGLQVLDLSSNQLSGPIPVFLAELSSLYYLNLSFNSFEGEVPDAGVFANSSAISVVGNKHLCGGNAELKLPPCTMPHSKRSHKVRVIVILAVTPVLSLVLLVCFIGVVHRLCKPKTISSLEAEDGMRDQHIKVTYADLVKATDGFSVANLIGAGSFGSVYNGVMEYDGISKLVAVKVLNLQQGGALKSFIAECEALCNVRHRNLVRILTSCSSMDFRGNDFKALVFELMQNGSLESWLHPQVNEQSEPKRLSLMDRLNIAIDVASALDYLHHYGPMPIVHCDLKPNNVLIDENMTARVADFGLARFLIESTTESSSNLTSSSRLIGSIGYIPPEYGMSSRVSTKGDVYSFGILLLEMFTGKRPTDDSFIGGLSLHKLVEMAIPEKVMDIADQQLFLQGEEKMSNIDKNVPDLVDSVFKIGLLCSKESPTERMQMGNAAEELHAIRDALLTTRTSKREDKKTIL